MHGVKVQDAISLVKVPRELLVIFFEEVQGILSSLLEKRGFFANSVRLKPVWLFA